MGGQHAGYASQSSCGLPRQLVLWQATNWPFVHSTDTLGDWFCCLQDEWGLDIGNWTYTNYAGDIVDQGQKPAPNRDTFTSWQQCLNACDDDYA